jgi:hypothetical protein
MVSTSRARFTEEGGRGGKEKARDEAALSSSMLNEENEKVALDGVQSSTALESS